MERVRDLKMRNAAFATTAVAAQANGVVIVWLSLLFKLFGVSSFVQKAGDKLLTNAKMQTPPVVVMAEAAYAHQLWQERQRGIDVESARYTTSCSFAAVG